MGRHERRATAALARREGWTQFERGPLPDTRVYNALGRVTATFSNSLYYVVVFEHPTECGLVKQLQVSRHDRQPIRSWGDMQRVKNEIAGEDAVAVEVYPAQRDVVDHAHAYHLWILPPGRDLPFGLHLEGM